MAKGVRDKIKLVSSAGTGHFYTTTKNRKTTSGKMNFQVRPGCSQARRLQGNEAQVILTASYSERSELKEPDAGCAAPGSFVLILY